MRTTYTVVLFVGGNSTISLSAASCTTPPSDKSSWWRVCTKGKAKNRKDARISLGKNHLISPYTSLNFWSKIRKSFSKKTSMKHTTHKWRTSTNSMKNCDRNPTWLQPNWTNIPWSPCTWIELQITMSPRMFLGNKQWELDSQLYKETKTLSKWWSSNKCWKCIRIGITRKTQISGRLKSILLSILNTTSRLANLKN